VEVRVTGEDRVLVRMKGISKRFPGVQALNKVDFELREGEVHVLLGENGAGKSTLVKILSGAYRKDEGEIFVNGDRVDIENPRQAMELGIATIYQEFSLIPFLSAAENVFLGREFSTRYGLIDWRMMYKEARRFMDSVGLKVSEKRKVAQLSVAEKQLLEIAKALSLNSRVIIFDEPTATLSGEEVKHLFKIVQSLKKEGRGIIYISHRLEEIEEVGDRCTVLRDGEYIGTVDIKSVARSDLIEMVAGRTVDLSKKFIPKSPGKVVFRVKGLKTTDRKVSSVTLDVREGEILGIAGLVGSGRTEAMKGVVGAERVVEGEVILNNAPIENRYPWDALEKGIVYLSEDRKSEGLVLKMNIRHNITLSSLDAVVERGFLSTKKEQEVVSKYIKSLKIKCPNDKVKASSLSGGNQQKVLVARALACKSKILIFDEPTRGIDVAAKEEIYAILQRLAEMGHAVIMISSEVPELLRCCNRIAVMREGKVVAILDREEASSERILHYALGGVAV